MYWQKRFTEENFNKKLEEKITSLRAVHKNFGYRCIFGELRKPRQLKYIHYATF